jgi:parallel beta-helix repeat protein
VKLRRVFVPALLIILFSLTLSSSQNLVIPEASDRPNRFHTSNLSPVNADYFTDHVPIIIDSDQDFEDLSFPGTGNQTDPYIIERYHIVATGYQCRAISITSTTVFFIIRDCYVVTEYAGIEVREVGDATAEITNNTCVSSTGFGGGIIFWSVKYSTITNNTCSNLSQGIHLNDLACRNYIAYNNITDISYQGINIRYSNRNVIKGNFITNSSEHGVALVGTSKYNIIYSNEFIDNGNEDTYRIDGEDRGQISSQAFDEGANNTWYDMVSEVGNYWYYTIDGPSESVDMYPIGAETFTDSDTDSTIADLNYLLMQGTATIGAIACFVIIGIVVYKYRFTNR